jgi:predicted cupin superfamily sugar epimerase
VWIFGAALTPSSPPPLAAALGLTAHPEGGWYRQVWRAELLLPASALPTGYSGPRPVATSISYLLGPGERSRWHRVRSAELWLWQGAGPLRLRLGGRAEQPEPTDAADVVLGPASLEEPGPGYALQHVVAPGEWQSAEPAAAGPTLVACVVAPGFAWPDFELAAE